MKYLFSNEKEQATETCNSMHESPLQYVKWKGQILKVTFTWFQLYDILEKEKEKL